MKVRARYVVAVFISLFIAVFAGSSVDALEWFDDMFHTGPGMSLLDSEQTRSRVPGCSFEWVRVTGLPGQHAVCVRHGKDVSVGVANGIVDSDGLFVSINGSGFYAPLAMEEGLSGRELMIGSDRNTLVVVSDTGGETRRVEVYINIQKTLTSRSNPTLEAPLGIEYVLPEQSHIVRDRSGVMADVWLNAMSENGRYIVIQVRNKGLARFDTDTFYARMFSDTQYRPGQYLAVSNSGQTVVASGASGSAELYDLGQQCGVNEIAAVSTAESCPRVDLMPTVRSALGLSAQAPVDGSKLVPPVFQDDYKFTIGYLKNSSGSFQTIAFMPNDYGEYGLDYLALGDSYSSGEGDTDLFQKESYYLQGTEKDGECHLSSRSYPFILRTKWDIAPDRMGTVACSGALVRTDMNGDMAMYFGQHDEMNEKPDVDKNQWRSDALEKFTPGVVPQIEFVRRYQPRILTLTGGGNDVKFANVLRYCADFLWVGEGKAKVPFDFTCDYANEDATLHKNLYDDIDTQYRYNRELIAAIKAASPKTRIVIVGYPSFLASKSPYCWWDDGSLDSKEKAMVEDALNRLNSMLVKVAHDEQVSYVNTESALVGGRICEGEKYVTGVTHIDLQNLKNLRFDQSFHPNAAGHAKLAERIYDSGVYDHDLIPTEGLFTRNVNAIQTFIHEIISGGLAYVSDAINAYFAGHTFLPGTTIRVSAYSTPVDLGTFIANDDGSLDLQLQMSKLTPGMHVLLVEGTDFTGEPVRYYQHIEVHATKDDADGDGIKDADDPCTFISALRNPDTGEYICGGPAASIDKTHSGDALTGEAVSNLASVPTLFLAGRSTDSGLDSMMSIHLEENSKIAQSMNNDTRHMIVWYAIIVVVTGGLIGGIIYDRNKQKN